MEIIGSLIREKVYKEKPVELVSMSENDLFAVNQEDEFSTHLFEIKLRLISSLLFLKQISLSGGWVNTLHTKE